MKNENKIFHFHGIPIKDEGMGGVCDPEKKKNKLTVFRRQKLKK